MGDEEESSSNTYAEVSTEEGVKAKGSSEDEEP